MKRTERPKCLKLRKMRVHSGYCTNILWVLILCLITAVEEKTAVMNNEPAAQSQPNNTTVLRAQSVGSHVNNKSRTDAVDVTSNISGVPRPLNSSQEIVQPSHKNISSGAYVRAFYVFVGLGAIVVMYIVVRTVR